MDYTIIGSGVNLASRLEQTAPPDEILISYETYVLVKDAVCCEERGHINVKGISHPVATYQVIDVYDNVGKSRDLIHEDYGTLNSILIERRCLRVSEATSDRSPASSRPALRPKQAANPSIIQ